MSKNIDKTLLKGMVEGVKLCLVPEVLTKLTDEIIRTAILTYGPEKLENVSSGADLLQILKEGLFDAIDSAWKIEQNWQSYLKGDINLAVNSNGDIVIVQ